MAGRRPSPRRWSRLERELRERYGPLIAGVDEVGRGPLAGPVVACAVVMPPDARAIAGVDDSKLVTPSDRVRLARKIRERAVAIGLGAASVREIDRVNVYHATVLAMRRAIARLGMTPHHVLLDGRAIRSLAVQHTAVVGGDRRCYSIACASILAKVTRDRLMLALARRYPDYRWERNVGYGTPEHWSRVESFGLTPHHRRSFIHPRQLDLGIDDLHHATTLTDAEIAELDAAELAFPPLADVVTDAETPAPAIVRGAEDQPEAR